MMRRRSDLPPTHPQPWSEMIPADSFYARLAKWRDVLVDDEDYAPLYKDSPRGRPSIPPSTVVLAMLLEYHDDCSDAEAEQRMRFDLRWKHALGIGLEDGGFDATVLCRFRRKLLECGLERALFERLVKAARETGLLAKDSAQLLDSSHILGAAGARDTYTLIRGAIRKLLRALGHATTGREALGERLWWYVDTDAPEKPDIDWADPGARAAHLREIVADAREALSLRRLMHNFSDQQIGQAAQRTTELRVQALPAGVRGDLRRQASQKPFEGLRPVALQEEEVLESWFMTPSTICRFPAAHSLPAVSHALLELSLGVAATKAPYSESQWRSHSTEAKPLSAR